jgi:hypothetical protein
VKMLQGPVRDSVRTRSLAHLEAPDCFLNLVRVIEISFAGRGMEILETFIVIFHSLANVEDCCVVCNLGRSASSLC